MIDNGLTLTLFLIWHMGHIKTAAFTNIYARNHVQWLGIHSLEHLSLLSTRRMPSLFNVLTGFVFAFWHGIGNFYFTFHIVPGNYVRAYTYSLRNKHKHLRLLEKESWIVKSWRRWSKIWMWQTQWCLNCESWKFESNDNNGELLPMYR